MIKNVIKDQEGYDIQWTDTENNCTTKIDRSKGYHKYNRYCSKCNTHENDMKFIKETGYYVREITLKCKCGNIVKYQS